MNQSAKCVCAALVAAGLLVMGTDVGVLVRLSSSGNQSLMMILLCILLVVMEVTSATGMLASARPLAVNYTSLDHRQQNKGK